MSNTKVEEKKLSKQSFSISELTIAVFFSTYFLTVQTIELSLSIYAIEENKARIYGDYLSFKSQAPIWKSWQMFANLIVLLSIITTTRDLFQTLTRHATLTRNVLDILKGFQIFSALFVSIRYILPIQTKFIESMSMNDLRDLNGFQWIIFALNLLGLFLPIFRYIEWKTEPKKKIE